MDKKNVHVVSSMLERRNWLNLNIRTGFHNNGFPLCMAWSNLDSLMNRLAAAMFVNNAPAASKWQQWTYSSALCDILMNAQYYDTISNIKLAMLH